MKALTIWQPWATLLVYGEKKYETRSWYPNVVDRRQKVAIHAGKKFVREAVQVPAITAALQKIRRRQGHVYWDGNALDLPRGKVLGVSRLEHVLKTEMAAAGIGARERDMGDWSDDRYAWRLRPVQVLSEPVDARGQQGLWNWDPEEAER